MKTIKKCNFCKSSNLKFLFYLKDKNFFVPGEFPILKCLACKLILMGIIPNAKKIEKYYPKEYYSFNSIQTKEESVKTRLIIFMQGLHFDSGKKNYLLRLLSLPILPFIRGIIISPDKKLLDIGSGSGQFLYEMKQFGMEAEGLEPGNFDKESSKKYNLNVKNTDLLGAKYPKEQFDIVTINHVLEHVPNPEKIIKEMHRITRKDGKLIVGVPNYHSLAFLLFGKNWYQLDVPRHFNNFSEKVLIKKLEESGFTVEKIRHNSRPTQFTISLFYFLNVNPKKHQIITNVLNIIFLPLAYIVNIIKWGDQIEIFCSK